MKKNLILLTFLFSFLIQACGPNEAELRVELQAIDREMVMLRNAAYRHQAEMSQSEFATLMGGFATGYGITFGEVDGLPQREMSQAYKNPDVRSKSTSNS